MNYRHAEILASANLGDSGTKNVDIKVVDPISRITVRHTPAGGSNVPADHPISNITKIELVDGSDVLYSLSGKEGQGLNICEAKTPVIQEVDARTGGVPMMYINMDFGRRLWDPELAFDPKKFVNPQIKLTWNEANYDAGCTSSTFMMYAHLFDEKEVSPIGFLMNKEIKSFEPSSGSYEYTDLPTDYPLRKLLIQAYKKGISVRGLCETIRLSEDNDKRIPIDGDIHQLRSFLDAMTGEVVEDVTGYAPLAGQYFYTAAQNLFTIGVAGQTSAKVLQITGPFGGRFGAAGESADIPFTAHIRGKNPHGLINIPFGLQDVIDDWYDVTKLGSLKLRLKGGTSSASGDSVNIVTQQLRRY